ncbi:MAG: PAQR family membrane homeostasis protein TrhA [Aureliella sp.]
MAICWTEENAAQETVNAWTHGLGLVLSVPAGIALNLLVLEHRSDLLYACLVYSLSLTAMYLFSTLSHAVREPGSRHRMRALDQGVIYLLIAGTFTPFMASYLTGGLRATMLAVVWLMAMAGFYSKVFARHRIDNMTSVSYVMMGWVPAMALISSVSLECFAMMALGGLLYTVGTLFLQNDHRSPYFHAVWHLMVILASACHYVAIAMFTILQLDR